MQYEKRKAVTSRQDQLIGAPVVDSSGEVIGSVSALLVDPQSLQGRWLQIQLAGATPRRAVLPLAGASVNAAGVMVSPWTAARVAGAPRVGDQVSAAQADALDAHYDLNP